MLLYENYAHHYFSWTVKTENEIETGNLRKLCQLGDDLRALRKAQGLHLAGRWPTRSGKSLSFISKIERGIGTPVHHRTPGFGGSA